MMARNNPERRRVWRERLKKEEETEKETEEERKSEKERKRKKEILPISSLVEMGQSLQARKKAIAPGIVSSLVLTLFFF